MNKSKSKRIMVDMSATLIHHGHIRLLKAAKELGHVVVALTTDEEIRNKKGYAPELNFLQRKEMLEAIRYVDEVVPCNWLLTNDFLDQHNIDFLVHGDDNSNDIDSEKLIILPRTEGISSDLIRKRAKDNSE
jgi:glycerol-3-phosphate cytidylyltransferase